MLQINDLTYDAWGRVTEQYVECGSVATCATGGLDARTTTTYDLLGNAIATTTYPGAGDNIVYPTLGLAGEAGEVAEKVKKMLRDDGGVMTGERLQALAGELGDVLWYVAQVATEAGLELEEVAQANLDKLLSRQQRGVLSGSGDSR